MYGRYVNVAGGDLTLLTAAGFALAGAVVVREILLYGGARKARRRLAGLLLAYSLCASRVGRGSCQAGSPERAREWADQYGDAPFREKLRTAARHAGSAVVERALALGYVAVSEETPAWARESARAALGYFIAPLDAVPDAAPAGFCDDLAVLAAALGAVAAYVTPAIRARAARRAGKLCGPAEGAPDAVNGPPAGEWPSAAL